MSEEYKLKEVKIEVYPNITIVAEVNSIPSLKRLLKDLAIENFLIPTKKEPNSEKKIDPKKGADSPSGKIELNAGIPTGSLSQKHVLAFKDGFPQFLKPSSFGSATDAILVLLHALELGMANQDIEYEAFRELYESQHVKSGSPLAMLITNIRNSGYLDNKRYKETRKLCLSPKGEKKAIEIVKSLVA